MKVRTKNKQKYSSMAEFGQRLDYAMNGDFNSISQTELAQDAGISQARISQLIHDVCLPRIPLAQKLAYLCGVSYQWLAYGFGDFKRYDDDYPIEEFWQNQSERIYYSIWSNGFSEKSVSQLCLTLQLVLAGKRYLTASSLERLHQVFKCPKLFLSNNWRFDRLKIEEQMPSFYEIEKNKLAKFDGCEIT